VPDPHAALASAVRVLKPGAPLLVYLYYALDNRPRWYRALWRASDLVRRGVSRSPIRVRLAITAAIAALIYLPLARLAKALTALGLNADHVPLAFYRDRSFYMMRTDAYDRFATRLEWRFTRAQVVAMMRAAGLVDVVISPSTPYWCAVGRRAA
jgi:hypothetical protein